MTETQLAAWEIDALAAGRHPDPFSRLGRHAEGKTTVIRAVVPGADSVKVFTRTGTSPLATLTRVKGALFEGTLAAGKAKTGYRLQAEHGGQAWDFIDAYSFGPVLGEIDLYLIGEGTHEKAYQCLGAHIMTHEGVDGVHFAVWAPNASQVALVGDFNHWNSIHHPMRNRGDSGIWELFVPGIGDGTHYKYCIYGKEGHQLPLKADPFAFGTEYRPNTASVVRDLTSYGWSDAGWMESRGERQHRAAPISIYEVHAGSWRRKDGNGFLGYRDLAAELIPYVKEMGFTHIELMPISEHPFDGSWGYQPIGLYSPTRRFGTPSDFKAFVDACHEADIGVLLDWVPGHFPADEHGLAHFDGTHLFDHADPKKGYHPDWNTLIFNYGRREVVNYLISNARFWLEEYHLDGLRVDAVASMLYLDYSREDGEWIANQYGGNQNLEAIDFLKRMNERVYASQDGIMTVAEESTAWPGVSAPTDAGGLGFGYKWNMGWMHDTLDYMSRESVYRRHHHHQMTFGIDYAFSENYVLPLSHDEVVHGKGSLLARMPGDRWQKFANLRAYFAFMWAHPGKKLLFMGGEFAQEQEWNAEHSLDWHLLDYAEHRNIQALIKDLNHLYRDTPALYLRDCERAGFEWVDGATAGENILVFLRRGGDYRPCLVVCNFSPMVRHNYRVGVPYGGRWAEVLNTDSHYYGGSGVGNGGGVMAEAKPWHIKPYSVSITVPPLSTTVFRYERD
ncbi:1,4-alpha-glucan branching protein GlgB [Kordiimonas marina]|uniref:1,4-alpha-glucan branching protein GlgB n=1 Tax=Kordiimonas marina TaxID=2872312 RepID=UPI001FF1E92C|nr:1,4-alpha-glucan branching protein GlgB [Kordiimonas marina]MCJ9427851.1 1,4-alpha-glucan branching protein GlgB [Kordiimonas marina]